MAESRDDAIKGNAHAVFQAPRVGIVAILAAERAAGEEECDPDAGAVHARSGLIRVRIAEGAIAFDRRLREALAVAAEKTLSFKLNYSAGWSLLRAGDRHVQDLMLRADAALYRAKAEGRGRLCAEPGLDAADSPADAPQPG